LAVFGTRPLRLRPLLLQATATLAAQATATTGHCYYRPLRLWHHRPLLLQATATTGHCYFGTTGHCYYKPLLLWHHRPLPLFVKMFLYNTIQYNVINRYIIYEFSGQHSNEERAPAVMLSLSSAYCCFSLSRLAWSLLFRRTTQ
jgi:hypothetical protein